MAARVSGIITVKNDQPAETVVTLEPGGDERRLLAAETIVVRFDGPEDIRVEIVTKPDGIVVFGWTGSVMEFAR
jgi:hypothetical protein